MSTAPNHVSTHCLDCDSPIVVNLGGVAETLCPKADCDRKFRAWSNRDRERAQQFYAKQPSTRRKELRKLPEYGRWLVSYVYSKVARLGVPMISRLIEDPKMLSLLLNGASMKLDVPLVLLYPKHDPAARADISLIPESLERIECMDKPELFLFPCFFFWRILKSKKCRECDNNRARYYMGDDSLYESGEKKDDSAPWRYPCWAGFTEFACPVEINLEKVAIFIAGQFLLDTPQGKQELIDGQARVEEFYPQLKTGSDFPLSELIEKKLSPAFVEEHLSPHTNDAGIQVVTVTTDLLYKMARLTAKQRDRLLSPDKLKQVRIKTSDAVQTVQEFLINVYCDNRALSEQEFLSELFALLECLPAQLADRWGQEWEHAGTLLRRLCEFAGFENGAVCIPTPDNIFSLKVPASYSFESAKKQTSPANQLITVNKGFYDKIYNKGFDFFDLKTKPDVWGTENLLQQINRLVTHKDDDHVTAAWVGYQRFGDPVTHQDLCKDSSFREDTPPPFGLLVLWQRVPWHNADLATTISPQTLSFLKRADYELSAGLYSWQSVLALQKAADERKRLIAESVHGLKSCIHLAWNETEIIDIVLERANAPKNAQLILMLMESIRADLADFVHKIRISNLFTVLDRAKVSYAIDSLESLSEIVKTCIHQVQGAAKRRGIRFHTDDRLSPDTLVKCDPDALETAITALLDNAVKYSYPDKIIYVRLTDLGVKITIEIEDFGKGILPSENEQIFEPFLRSQIADYKQSVPGTGIGLTVCRDVIRAHKGSVAVKRSHQEPDHYKGTSVSEVSGHNVIFGVILPKGVK